MSTAVAVKDPVQFQVNKMGGEFAKALPSHIPSEKFARTAITAIKNNDDLARAFNENPTSVFSSLMKAAQDGLVPDGRQAALVVFNSKNRQTGQWLATAQYMPMIAGIMQKVRNSGEIEALHEPQIVYQKDEFVLQLGDEPKLVHNPLLFGERGPAIGAYAVAKLKDGSTQRTFMTVDEINKRREASKAGKSGPWVDWWDEMAKKTVLKQLCKYLPQSTDLDAAFERDETMKADLNGRTVIDAEPQPQDAEPEAPATLSKLDQFAEAEDAEVIDSDGEVHDSQEAAEEAAQNSDFWGAWTGGEPIKGGDVFHGEFERQLIMVEEAQSEHGLKRIFATQEPAIREFGDKDQLLLRSAYNKRRKQFAAGQKQQ